MSFAEKDILVVLEVADDAPVGVSIENIGAAKVVANGGKIIAVALESEAAAAKAIEYGADCAIVVTGVDADNAEAIAAAVAEIAAEVKPAAILTAATPAGKGIVARVASALNGGAVTDATAVALDDAGNIVFTVPAFSGNILTDVVIDSVRPQVAAIRGGSVPKPEAEAGKAGEIVKKAFAGDLKTKVKNVVKEIAESVNIEEAEIIVCGGRGMGSQENFDILEGLAEVTGGVVACTRPAQEAGWCSRSRLVGQSGKIVAPKVYFAIALSGATQHVSAMLGSGYIIAVNKDEEAPIFDISDVGIVGNAMDVVPLLIEEIKKLKA